MAEYELNQLKTSHLLNLAHTGGTFLIATGYDKVEIELYYLAGHFVEFTYSIKKDANGLSKKHLRFANHFPDSPSSTKYFMMYLEHIELAL